MTNKPIFPKEVVQKVRYYLTWKSDTQRTRKEAYFASRTIAEEWYNEKLTEGKKPKLWKEETTTTFEAMRPQEEDQ